MRRPCARRIGPFVGPLVALSLCACGLGSGAVRPTSPPPLDPATPFVSRARAEPPAVLSNGLRVIQLPGPSDTVEMALLMPGGPMDDPHALAGLTSLLPDIGLLSEAGPGPQSLSPQVRALALGGEIRPVSGDGLFGWFLACPAASGVEGMKLLSQLARPRRVRSKSLKRVLGSLSQELSGISDAAIYRALAVAASAALGHESPVGLFAAPDSLARVTPADIRAHWDRLVRPKRGVFVLRGGGHKEVAPWLETLFKDWTPDADLGRQKASCWSERAESHLVLESKSSQDRLYFLLALRVPGRGQPGRAEIDLAVEALTALPNGRLAALVGEDRVANIQPQILDLGWNHGGTGSMLLLRISGPSKETLKELREVIELLRTLGDEGLTPAEVSDAAGRLQGASPKRQSQALGDVLKGALRVVYGEASGRESHLGPHLRSVFRDRNMTVVAVGPRALGRVLSEVGSLSIWDPGGLLLKDGRGPRCKGATSL